MKSKRFIVIVALISVLSLCCIGTVFAYSSTKNAEKVIELVSNCKGEVVSITNSAVDEYFAADDEKTQLDVLLNNEKSENWSESVTLSWKQNGSSFYSVYISEDESFENARCEKVFGYTPTLELYNLIPGKTYYWKVQGTYSNDTSLVGSFTTKDSAVRTIYVDGVSNVRDLGGYNVASGTVNYGLLYRGGKLNGTASGESITDEGKATMLNQLGIKTEIDLRSSSDDGGQTQNAIGDGVCYIKAPLGQYANVIDYETWLGLGKEKVSGNYDANNKNTIKKLFEILADKNNYPIYFHCNAGADRTGTLALLINGLLGVDEQSLIKDYELTTFSRYGKRLRSSVSEDGKSFTDSGIMQNNENNYVAMGLFIDTLKANYTDNGTINEAIYNYLVEYIGLSNETINQIKEILLLKTSQSEEYKKIDGVQEILLTDEVKSINISGCGVELSSINSIKIGKCDLGKNLNSLSFDDLDKRVFGDKEIIVCGTGADGKNYRIEVPVLIITKEIEKAAELKEVIDYSESKTETYGYYRLVKDITYTDKVSYGGNITNTSGIYGFKGTIDGKDKNGTIHTINYDCSSWSNGMFGVIGAGATIKNITFSGKYSGNQAPMIGATIVGATFDNVTFNITGGRDQIAGMNGLITKCMICNTSFKNVTINAEGVVIDSLFGGSQYAGYSQNKPCSFENFEINAEKVLELAHEQSTDDALKSVSIFSVDGIKGSLSKESSTTSTVYFSNNVGYLTIDDEFSDSEIVSITFGDKIITDFITLDGMVRFDISKLFKESDIGEKKVEIALKTKGGINVKLYHTVDFKSDLKVVDFKTVQDVVLSSDKVTLSLKDGDTDYSEYSNIHWVKYDANDLGTDIGDLNVTAIKDNFELHGLNKSIEVLADNGEKAILIRIPVTIITKYLTSGAEFKEAVYCSASDGEKNKGAYYVIPWNLNVSGTDFTGAGWVDLGAAGFAGTIDGRGHKIVNVNLNNSLGLFNALKGAVIKDVEIEVTQMYTTSVHASVFGVCAQDTVFENVTITFTSTFTGVQCGILGGANQSKGCTFKNIKVNAQGSDIYRLFSAGIHVANSKDNIINVVVFAKSVQYMYATTDLKTSRFSGVTINLDN